MVKPIHTNLQVLGASRKTPMPGDLFAWRPAGHPFYFGRVIRTDGDIRGMRPAILIYLYASPSGTIEDIPVLRPTELLVPPILTNRLPWSRGYFSTLKNVPLTRWDVLPVHAFRTDMPPFLVDEQGRPVKEPAGPVGQYGLHSYRTIDDAISDALGIPRAPD